MSEPTVPARCVEAAFTEGWCVTHHRAICDCRAAVPAPPAAPASPSAYEFAKKYFPGIVFDQGRKSAECDGYCAFAEAYAASLRAECERLQQECQEIAVVGGSEWRKSEQAREAAEKRIADATRLLIILRCDADLKEGCTTDTARLMGQFLRGEKLDLSAPARCQHSDRLVRGDGIIEKCMSCGAFYRNGEWITVPAPPAAPASPLAEAQRVVDSIYAEYGNYICPPFNLAERIAREFQPLRAECEALRQWKASMIAVTPDMQRIGGLIGVQLGDSVHDKIVPWIEQRLAECERLQQELEITRKSCSFCHQLQGHAADCWTVKQVEAREAAEKRCKHLELRLSDAINYLKDYTTGSLAHQRISELEAALNPPAQPTEEL